MRLLFHLNVLFFVLLSPLTSNWGLSWKIYNRIVYPSEYTMFEALTWNEQQVFELICIELYGGMVYVCYPAREKLRENLPQCVRTCVRIYWTHQDNIEVGRHSNAIKGLPRYLFSCIYINITIILVPWFL